MASSSSTPPLTVFFQTQVTGVTQPTQYDWWFGDGTHIVGTPTMTYTYNNPWTYNVVVRVLNWHGCWSQSSVTVIVANSRSDYSGFYVGIVVVIVVIVAAGLAAWTFMRSKGSERRRKGGPVRVGYKLCMNPSCGTKLPVGAKFCDVCGREQGGR